MKRNYGLIYEEFIEEDWQLGASGNKIVLQENRDWTEYLPKKEIQRVPAFDTFACVTFSALNCIETLIKRTESKEVNFSDRYTAKASDTNPEGGNTVKKVAESVRKDGLVYEADYPFSASTKKEYYQPLTEDLKKKAKKIYSFYTFNWEYVPLGGYNITAEEKAQRVYDALQYSPLQVILHAWSKPDKDGFYPQDMSGANHAVMLYNARPEKVLWIYDHYDKDKKALHWNYYLYSAVRYIVTKHTMKKLIKGDKQAQIYAVGDNGKLYHVYNMPALEEGAAAGLWTGEWEELPQKEVDAMDKAYSIGFLI